MGNASELDGYGDQKKEKLIGSESLAAPLNSRLLGKNAGGPSRIVWARYRAGVTAVVLTFSLRELDYELEISKRMLETRHGPFQAEAQPNAGPNTTLL